jgi:hypothetical protein
MNNEYPIINNAQAVETEHDLNTVRRAGPKKTALSQLIASWFEEDEQEQHDTFEALKKALDEDRLSERKLFP